MAEGIAKKGSPGNVLVSGGVVAGVAGHPREGRADVEVEARGLEWGFEIDSEGVEEGGIVFLDW